MKTKKNLKGVFHQNLTRITLEKIEKMVVIDSEDHIRFLKDTDTGLYVIFNGRMNQTFYSSKYFEAERFFNNLIKLTN